MPEYVSNYINAISKYPGTSPYKVRLEEIVNDIDSALKNRDIKSLDKAYEQLSATDTACEAFIRNHAKLNK